ncbi:unnamed protein product [Rotaria magnacalcarata]|uniref:Uncharacterized protein n=1 Tax=Rotaria magnacalcarata TaxID=392030 RepID=A0A816W3P2_9BILA|nr:unnamed protein product [Rotaria magnacalcarata]CAF2131311.1 unnamed protein product [Rotaria magnacalcarata]CAF4076218.1 unnamed protein product [Rotaria magnacalcarata]CAF4310540.1 unnamed protein product [Rotaria magnacalcarata]
MTEAHKVTHSNVNEDSNANNDWNTDEEFDDIFNIFDDDKDTLEYTGEEFNKYFFSGHLPAMVYEEETMDDDSFQDDDVVIVETMQQEADDDVVLSQKFSQLSTNVEDDQTSDVTRKRQRSSVAQGGKSGSRSLDPGGSH